MKLFILLLFSVAVGAQEQYLTKTFREDIRSLEVKVAGEVISNPVIELNGEAKIEISFDALHQTGRQFTYSVYHCDADGKRSALLPIEYMNGFQGSFITDYVNSIATTVGYTNYKLFLPNDDMQFLVSGNYVAVVCEDNAPDKPVLTACFSVVEPLVEIESSVLGNTDIDFNKSHQQLEFVVNQKNINIAFPQTELKIFVCQNNNHYDVRTDLQPTMFRGKQLIYNHNRNLIFDAGNEYRRIEFQTHRYNGMGVDKIGYYEPYYHVTLFQDERRNRKAYSYDQDQNGRFFVRCSGCESPDNEADYYVVHFSLSSDRLAAGDVYLFGDMFGNITDERSKMEYNTETGAYEKAVLLKNGQYNYQYVFVGEGDTKPSFSLTEGNFFETENEYLIKVFYRPPGARFDRLIGALH